jgi:hypothetical protein
MNVNTAIGEVAMPSLDSLCCRLEACYDGGDVIEMAWQWRRLYGVDKGRTWTLDWKKKSYLYCCMFYFL